MRAVREIMTRFDSVEQEGSSADDGVGVIESDEHDRHAIDVHALADIGRLRLQAFGRD
jgi:hypothetical protein